ncbi:allantoate deiminase 2 [Tanacetum coccineum]
MDRYAVLSGYRFSFDDLSLSKMCISSAQVKLLFEKLIHALCHLLADAMNPDKLLPLAYSLKEPEIGVGYRAHSVINFNRNNIQQNQKPLSGVAHAAESPNSIGRIDWRNIQQTTMRICSLGKMYMTTQVITVHIELRPVLESVGLPLTVVKGIAGQTRIKLTVRGSQGHAATVPTSMRQEPMVMISFCWL